VREIISASLGGMSYGNLLANAASAFILAVGIFAALSQLHIAPAILNAVFYAFLAVIAGSAIVAIGGGGIQPMRAQWERAIGRIEDEARRCAARPKGRRKTCGSAWRSARTRFAPAASDRRLPTAARGDRALSGPPFALLVGDSSARR
jgi:hypothetical protein